MQKFVTICLHCSEDQHGAVQEHLTDLLAHGWRILSVNPMGSSSGATAGVVWVAVVLEKGVSGGTGQFLSPSQTARVPFDPFLPIVEFPQSDEGRPVQPSDIPVGPETPLEIGSTVLSYSQGRWWRAEVIGLEPGDKIRIHFPGWDAKWDVTVPREELQVDLHASDE